MQLLQVRPLATDRQVAVDKDRGAMSLIWRLGSRKFRGAGALPTGSSLSTNNAASMVSAPISGSTSARQYDQFRFGLPWQGDFS